MGFRTGAFAKVWDVKPFSDTKPQWCGMVKI